MRVPDSSGCSDVACTKTFSRETLGRFDQSRQIHETQKNKEGGGFMGVYVLKACYSFSAFQGDVTRERGGFVDWKDALDLIFARLR